MSKKIAFVEDEQLIRESVTAIIEAKTSHVISYSCGSVEDFLKQYRAAEVPDMMLLDIGLPGMSGVSAISRFLELMPNLDIIVFSTYEEDETVFKALRAGACSYVSKRSSPAKVIDAIDVVAQGGAYMSPAIARRITNYFSSGRTAKTTTLSDRHKEIVSYVVKGHSYTDIAKKMYLSHNTIKTHVKRIYQLLRINSKAGLMRKYYDGELD